MAIIPAGSPKQVLNLLGPRLIPALSTPLVIVALAGICASSPRLQSTSITMVNYATPVKATSVVQPGLLTGKVALAGTSRSNGILSPADLHSRIDTVTPSRAVSRSPGADLTTFVPNFDLGSGLSRSSGVLQPSAIKIILAAAPSRASSSLPGTTLKSILIASQGRSIGRLVGANLTVRVPMESLTRAQGVVPGAFLGGKVSLSGLTRSNGLGVAQLSTHFPTTDIGGAISRDVGRTRSTGIVVVGYATPARDVGRLTGTIRFVGAGFDMGAGLSRVTSRARATGITRVHYATPIRTGHRLWGAIQLWYDAVPIRSFGYARVVTTLGQAGQAVPSNIRGTGRAVSLHLKLHYAIAPVVAGSRATAVLQFASGVTTPVAGISRATAKAHALQLLTTGGTRAFMAGTVRHDHRLLTATTLLTYYLVTPSKADPRLTGWLHSHQETGPSRQPGGLAHGQLSFHTTINLHSTSRHSTRVVGAFVQIKPQLVGASVEVTRAIGQISQQRLALLASASRDISIIHCSPLEFLPITIVQHNAAPSRQHARAYATVHSYQAAQPSCATSRCVAVFSSTQPLISTCRAQSVALGQLTFTGAFVVGVEGQSVGTTRVVGDTLKITNAGGWILSGSGRVIGALPSFALRMQGASACHARSWGVLAFTGSTLLPITGRSIDHAIAWTPLDITHLFSTQRSRGTALVSCADLFVLMNITGVSLDHGVAVGAFASGYEQASSVAHGIVQAATLVSQSPLDGLIVGSGRLVGDLTIPKELPQKIFFAKNRVFVWIAHDRCFVIAAKDRRFLFYAGGQA